MHYVHKKASGEVKRSELCEDTLSRHATLISFILRVNYRQLIHPLAHLTVIIVLNQDPFLAMINRIICRYFFTPVSRPLIFFRFNVAEATR